MSFFACENQRRYSRERALHRSLEIQYQSGSQSALSGFIILVIFWWYLESCNCEYSCMYPRFAHCRSAQSSNCTSDVNLADRMDGAFDPPKASRAARLPAQAAQLRSCTGCKGWVGERSNHWNFNELYSDQNSVKILLEFKKIWGILNIFLRYLTKFR